jgi:hypothetical protein
MAAAAAAHAPVDGGSLLKVDVTSSKLENLLETLDSRIGRLEALTDAREKHADRAPQVPRGVQKLLEIPNVAASSDPSVEHLRKALAVICERLNSFYGDVRHREDVQAATDAAQDEIMTMEFDKIGRELASKVSKKEISALRQALTKTIESGEEKISQQLDDRIDELEAKVSQDLSKVLSQVRNVKESTETAAQLLKDRMQNVMQGVEERFRTVETSLGIGSDGISEQSPIGVTLSNALQKAEERAMEESAELRSALADMQSKVDSLELEMAELRSELKAEAESAGTQMSEELSVGLDRIAEMVNELKQETSDQTSSFQEQQEQQASRSGAFQMELAKVKEEMKLQEAHIREVQKAAENVVHESRLELEMQVRVQLQENRDGAASKLSEGLKDLRGEMNSGLERIRSHAAKARSEITVDAQRSLDAAMNLIRAEMSTAQEAAASTQESVQIRLNKLDARGSDMLESLQLHRSNHEALSHRVDAAYSHLAQADREIDENRQGAIELERSLSKALATFAEEQEASMKSVQRSNIALLTMVRAMDNTVSALATKDRRWDRVDAQCKAHAQSLGKKLVQFESRASVSEPFSMAMDEQKSLAGVCQMVAKLIATKADFEITRQAMVKKNPADVTDWDARIESLRVDYQASWMKDILSHAKRAHPTEDHLIAEVRAGFMEKLNLAIRLALSKYRPIAAGHTILGRVGLLPSCMACDRPFTEAASHGAGGDIRAASPMPMSPPRTPPPKRKPILGKTAGASASTLPSSPGMFDDEASVASNHTLGGGHFATASSSTIGSSTTIMPDVTSRSPVRERIRGGGGLTLERDGSLDSEGLLLTGMSAEKNGGTPLASIRLEGSSSTLQLGATKANHSRIQQSHLQKSTRRMSASSADVGEGTDLGASHGRKRSIGKTAAIDHLSGTTLDLELKGDSVGDDGAKSLPSLLLHRSGHGA